MVAGPVAVHNRLQAGAFRRDEGVMTRYWVLGLVVAVVALIYLARLILSMRKSAKDSVDIPLWEPESWPQSDLRQETTAEREDTAPAVLSPPEWRPPKSVSDSTSR
jgi:hypothetical protein